MTEQAITPAWIEKNRKYLPRLKAEYRRDERKLKRLARHVERKRQQIEAIERTSPPRSTP